MDPDALVASPNPWNILFWCGNAGYLVPPDLDDHEWLDRYLDEQKPGYLISAAPETVELFETSPRLERVVSHGPVALFRVANPRPGTRPWRSTGPLAELGPFDAAWRAPPRRRAGPFVE
jgi:hypothetical protein